MGRRQFRTVSLVRPANSTEYEALKRDAIGGSLWTILASGLNLPLTFLVSVIAARRLGPTEYGQYTVLFTLIFFAEPIFNGGVSEASIQWIAEYASDRDGTRSRALLRRTAGYHVLVQGPLTVLFVIVMTARYGWPSALIASAVVGVYVLFESSSVVLIGMARNDLAARFTLVMTVTSSTAMIASSFISPVAVVLWVTQLACTLVKPTLALLALDRGTRRAVLTPSLPRAFPKGFRMYAITAACSGVASLFVFGRSEVFVLSLYDKRVAIAEFAVASAMAGKLTILIDSAASPLLPITLQLAKIDMQVARSAVTRAIRFTTVLALLTAGVILPVITALIPILYGSAYAKAQIAFAFLGVVSCIESLAAPFIAIAFATRSIGTLLLINLTAVCVDGFLAFSLCDRLGLWGAVAASCAAQLVFLALLVVRVARQDGSHSADAINALWGAAAVAMCATTGAGAVFIGTNLFGGQLAPVLGAVFGCASVAVTFVSSSSLALSIPDGELAVRFLTTGLRPLALRTLCRVRVVQPLRKEAVRE